MGRKMVRIRTPSWVSFWPTGDDDVARTETNKGGFSVDGLGGGRGRVSQSSCCDKPVKQKTGSPFEFKSGNDVTKVKKVGR
jgi:hypothetical protein